MRLQGAVARCGGRGVKHYALQHLAECLPGFRPVVRHFGPLSCFHHQPAQQASQLIGLDPRRRWPPAAQFAKLRAELGALVLEVARAPQDRCWVTKQERVCAAKPATVKIKTRALTKPKAQRSELTRPTLDVGPAVAFSCCRRSLSLAPPSM